MSVTDRGRPARLERAEVDHNRSVRAQPPTPLSRLASFLLACLALPLAAQNQVWVLDDAPGPGVDFTQLADALQVASEGDVLLFRDGTYGPPPFTPYGWGNASLSTSLSLIADTGANVVLQDWSVFVPSLAEGQRIVVRGLQFVESSLYVQQSAGEIVVEDCVFPPFPTPKPGPLRVLNFLDSAAVHLVRCTIQGQATTGPFPGPPGHAIRSTNTNLYLWDCSVQAGAAAGSVSAGQALIAEGGRVFAQGGGLVGGPGQAPLPPVFPCGDGGVGVRLLAGAELILRDASVLGGPVAVGCDGQAQVGPAFELLDGSVSNLPGLARSLNVPSPLREGVPGAFSYSGQASDLVLLAASPLPTTIFDPVFLGGALVPGITGLQIVSLGVAASGTLPGVLTGPALPTGIEGRELYAQAVAITPGALVIPSSPTAVTLLASGF